uniref:Uncharacterized protein n=1 Tax=Arundo donax TaxID=35708 RepID=A0A0A9U0H3_ARUDO
MVLGPLVRCKKTRSVRVPRVNKIKFTWWRMWELVTIFAYSVIKHSHVMHRSRPAPHSKGEPHVKVTYSQYILSSISMTTNILKDL